MEDQKNMGLKRAAEIYRHRGQRAKQLKKEGKKVFGYFCCYPPIELLTALDITAVRVLGNMAEPVTEADQPGIMWVRMGSNAAGYWNRDENTRAAFDKGWYCTGDMFTRDEDGWYRHEGRGDDMLKISGQWVSPGEIEEHVLKVPGVDNAAVVGVPNEDGLVRLALFLVAPQATENTEALETEIRETLTSSLSIYKCPRRMFFVDDLPVTGSGKVRRFELREMAEQHAIG